MQTRLNQSGKGWEAKYAAADAALAEARAKSTGLSAKVELMTRAAAQAQAEIGQYKDQLGKTQGQINSLRARLLESVEKTPRHDEVNTLRGEIESMSDKLEQNNKQIEFLQDTVARECQEREDLTRELAKARGMPQAGDISRSALRRSATSTASPTPSAAFGFTWWRSFLADLRRIGGCGARPSPFSNKARVKTSPN